MTERPWGRVKEVCLAALELPLEERSVYLDGACEGDARLRSEVESLLRQYDPDFLEEPLVRVGQLHVGADARPAEEPIRLGPYRIVRPVGRGGMGEVFLAIQEGDGFERPVAIKLVRPGMATDDVLERFRRERAILAGLNHPNLAQLIEGGATDDGRPFFVMEFVEGEAITDFCDRNALPVEDRLHLFMTVCDAVHHAHQSLVVHRDIKPSNILVTPEGVPKLLDFGIGKVLDGDAGGAADTAMTRRVLTPEYAAPEQIQGGLITTATDVHGLGVLLYELLTGHHPFSEKASTPEQLDRAVLETPPTTPSTVVAAASRIDDGGTIPSPSDIAKLRGTVPLRLRRALRGDLDNIVLKALRKEPDRRYSSAETLRSDIQRHLDGRPVRARPDSFRYRFTKFATRNPWGMAAAVLALIALGTAVVLPWQQNRVLSAERDKALAVQGFLLEAFGTTGGDATIGASDLLDLQVSRLDTLYSDRPALQAEMLMVLSDAYDRLGQYAEALPPAQRSLAMLRDLHGGDHPDLGRALNAFGWALHRAGQTAEAAPVLEEAVALRRRLGRNARGELSRSLNDLGVVREAMQQFPEAEVLHREALALRRSVLGDSDLATGTSASNLAVVLYRLGDYEAAQLEAELALALLGASVGPDHQRTTIVQNNLAAFMVTAGDLEGAAAVYGDLLARQSRLQGVGHPVTNTVRNGLASVLRRLGRHDEAFDLASEVRAHAREQGDAGAALDLSALATLVSVRRSQGRNAEALILLDEAVAIADRLRGGRSPRERAARAEVRYALGNAEGAAEDYRVVVQIQEPSLEADSDALARLRLRLAEYLYVAGGTRSADSLFALVQPVVDSGRAGDVLLDRFERVDSIRSVRGR